MTWTVYKIEHVATGRGYIGITNRGVAYRWARHKESVKKGSQTAIYRAMRKYGIEAFSIRPIVECVDAVEAKTCERALIAAHGTYAHSGGGFNLTIGGDGNAGWRPSSATKAKIGAVHRGKVPSAELRALWSSQRKGKKKPPVTDETRKKIGDAHRGKKLSAEQRAKISAAGIGRTISPESIKKATASRAKTIADRGYGNSPETRARISAGKTGKKMSPEVAAAAAARLAAYRDSMTAEMKAAQSERLKNQREKYLSNPDNLARFRQQTIERNKAKAGNYTDEDRAWASERSKRVYASLRKDEFGRIMPKSVA